MNCDQSRIKSLKYVSPAQDVLGSQHETQPHQNWNSRTMCGLIAEKNNIFVERHNMPKLLLQAALCEQQS